MKTIAFFVRNIDPEKYPFSVRELYYYSYQEYLLAMKRAGAEVFFVTGNDSYLGDGRFALGYAIDTVSEVKDFRLVGEFEADLVFDKGGFEGDGVKTMPDKRLRRVMDDKAETYERFREFQPLSVTCGSVEEVRAAMGQMPGDRVVIKSPFGSGGSHVYIGTKDEMAVPEHEGWPLMVQEFLDMSEGIPGVVTGPHDLRVLVAGGTILGATLRVPAPGSLYANVSKGGTERLLSVEEIPDEVKVMAHKIDAELDDLPRYYAIDFARSRGKWYLMELNNKPGLFREANGPLARTFMDGVAKYLVGLI
jgi:glutathione synthase